VVPRRIVVSEGQDSWRNVVVRYTSCAINGVYSRPSRTVLMASLRKLDCGVSIIVNGCVIKCNLLSFRVGKCVIGWRRDGNSIRHFISSRRY